MAAPHKNNAPRDIHLSSQQEVLAFMIPKTTVVILMNNC